MDTVHSDLGIQCHINVKDSEAIPGGIDGIESHLMLEEEWQRDPLQMELESHIISKNQTAINECIEKGANIKKSLIKIAGYAILKNDPNIIRTLIDNLDKDDAREIIIELFFELTQKEILNFKGVLDKLYAKIDDLNTLEFLENHFSHYPSNEIKNLNEELIQKRKHQIDAQIDALFSQSNTYDEITELLASINHKNLVKKDALLEAVKLGRLELVKQLVDKVNFKYYSIEDGFENNTLLRCVIENNHEKVAEYLIKNEKYVNYKTESVVDLPMYFAVEQGNEKIVKYLLEKEGSFNNINFIFNYAMNKFRQAKNDHKKVYTNIIADMLNKCSKSFKEEYNKLTENLTNVDLEELKQLIITELSDNKLADDNFISKANNYKKLLNHHRHSDHIFNKSVNFFTLARVGGVRKAFSLIDEHKGDTDSWRTVLKLAKKKNISIEKLEKNVTHSGVSDFLCK